MKELTLKISVNEVNTIIKALGQFPYNQVFELVGKIHDQASVQVKGEVVKMNSTEENKENQN